MLIHKIKWKKGYKYVKRILVKTKQRENYDYLCGWAGGRGPDDMGHAWREKVCDEDAQLCVSVSNRFFGVVLSVRRFAGRL